MKRIATTSQRPDRKSIRWYFGIGRDDRLYLFKSSLIPLNDRLQKFFLVVSGPFRTRGKAVEESHHSAAHYKEFLAGRLPHQATMSPEQHALVTVINAMRYLTDQEPKRLLFSKFCQQIGLNARQLSEMAAKEGRNGSYA